MNMTTLLIKKTIELELAYRCRGLVHDHHGRKHDHLQADMVLEKEQRESSSSGLASSMKGEPAIGHGVSI